MGPQTKAIIWNAIFTLILLVVTGFYAWFTWEMKNTIALQFKMAQEQSRPYVFVDSFKPQPENFEGLKYVMTIKNTGDIPAKFKIEKFCIQNENNCNEDENIKRDSFIFPDSAGSKLGAIGNPADFLKEVMKFKKIKIIFKLNYWSINDREMKKTYFFETHIEAFQDPNNPQNLLHKTIYRDAN